MATPRSLDALASQVATPGVRSVRVLALSPANDEWLDDDRSSTLFSAVARAGCPLIICAFATQLERLYPLVAAHPQVPVVIDDCGVATLEDGLVPDKHPLHTFAELGHVAVKVFSPMLLAAARQGTASGLIDQMVGAFGAQRVAWGSNYPQSGLSYATLVGAARAATAALAPSDRDAVLEGTAAGLWFG
jgi:predicted TIM-barrel fold metal-dependent hydrolase